MDLEMRVHKMEEKAKKMVEEIEWWTKKMAEKIEALWWENETLRLKAMGLRENKHIEGGEHIIEGVDNDEVNKKRVHDKLHNLTDRYKEIAKKIGGSSTVE